MQPIYTISCYVAFILISFMREVVGGGGCDQELCLKSNKDSYPLPVECSGDCLFVCAIGNYFYNINDDKVCHVYSGKTSRFPTAYGVCSNGRCGNGEDSVATRSNNASFIQRRDNSNDTFTPGPLRAEGDDVKVDSDPKTVCEKLDPKSKPYNLFCEGTCSFTCILGEPHFRENGKECKRNNGLTTSDSGSQIVEGTCYHGVCLTEDEKQYC